MGRDEAAAGEKYWQVIEPFWDSISIYDGPQTFLNQFRKVKPQIGNLYAAHWLYSEVCNGGFHQFFSNSTGVLAPEAAAGFRAIGLEDCAAVIEEAMRFFGRSYPREQEKRNEMLDAIPGSAAEEWNPFFKLDERFYKLVEGDRFETAADEYAGHHAA
jgi:hypothetical protein